MLRDLKTLWVMVRGARGSGSHGERMEKLYREQARDYDQFRERSLHGREDLLDLLDLPPGARVVEMGGGTGWNVERFGERLRTFDRVTIVDLCGPLIEIAKERCSRHRWTNVGVAQADATVWRPEDGRPVDAVYFSYSLTMIPDWFRAVDNAIAILRPGGLLGVVDFYVSRKHPAEGFRRHRALARAFWRWWFGHNDVFPSPDHIPYLEWKLRRRHLSERFGKVPYLPFLRAPHYIYVGEKP
ncbi:MAG: class I SAM-dependent methyltransferase [Planctomycetota bacterium]